MSKVSSEVDSILSTLSFISERGILGGIYLGSFCFVFVLANDQIKSDTYPWLAGIFFLLGLIFSNITYEFMLMPLRPFSEPVVLNSFHAMVEKSPEQTKIKKYNKLREFRELFFASNGSEHLKSLIHKEDKLRLTLTYLLSSNILILIILLVANQNALFVNQNAGIYKEIIQFEIWIALFTLVTTLFGEFSRSQAIGRSIGLAYKEHFKNSDEVNETEVNYPQGDVKKRPVLCLDFDGVLHWYRNGWSQAKVIDDIPVSGAKEFVEEATKSFDVVVFSSRCRFKGGKEAIREWLAKNGFPEVEVIGEKPAAHIVIDDRAFVFTGQWPKMEELLAFKPWNEKDKVRKTA